MKQRGCIIICNALFAGKNENRRTKQRNKYRNSKIYVKLTLKNEIKCGEN